MPNTKHALIRYRTLDRCFGNPGKSYSFQDLLDQVNQALAEHDASTSGIQTRQLRDDIAFMRRAEGYNAPIDTVRQGGRYVYRYTEDDFSINNSPLNATESEQLKAAIDILQRFEGAPGFEWLQDMGPMLSDRFGFTEREEKFIGYESNIDYSGYAHIGPLFNAILHRAVLRVSYAPFVGEAFDMTFHPHYLKEFNDRWFCFGYNEEMKIHRWNMALDRIQHIETISGSYEPSETDWEDFFSDMIGVTHREGALEEVHLRFSKEQAPYVLTKPLHSSQKTKELADGSLEVFLKLIPNFELQSLILSFGERVQVLAPSSLRATLTQRVKLLSEVYI